MLVGANTGTHDLRKGHARQRCAPSIIVSGCWAHVRRKFTEIFKSLPAYNREGSPAMQGKVCCNRLFALEREFSKLSPDANVIARHKERLQQSKPVMDAFFARAGSGGFFAPPGSPLGKELAYALGERKRLENNVLLDGRLGLSMVLVV